MSIRSTLPAYAGRHRGARTAPLGGARAGLVCALALAAGTPLAARANGPLPGAGSDTFDSVMDIVLEIGTSTEIIHLEGPTTIFRNDPVPGTGSDPCTVELEIVSMRLVGTSPFGEVVVTPNPERSSLGMGTTGGPPCVHPTDVFFDVFVRVDVESLPEPLVNVDAVRVQADGVLKFPPLFDTHTHPPPAIPLFFASSPGGSPVAMIAGQSTHTPVQRLTFSIDDQRASALIDPADLLELGNPPVARIQKQAIGLVTGDDVDALSFGVDEIAAPEEMDVFFSVDPSAVGAPNTGVNREALMDEAEGDEFVSNVNNTNIEALDEQGIVLVPRPPAPGDDLDALTNQPTGRVDVDGDGAPDRPVFFSLDAGSPTLTSLGADPADILVWDPAAGMLRVFATANEMGLVAGDEIDALCLMKPDLPSTTVTPGIGGGPTAPPPGNILSDTALLSLAPGSPSLASLGAGPGDLLITNFNGAWQPAFPIPPVVYILDSEIGLLDTDNLNALKCAAESVVIPIGGGPGGALTPGFVTIMVGAPFNDGDPNVDPPAPGQPGAFDYWFTINPFFFVFDFHGPFFLPQVMNPPANADVLDYRDVVWRNEPGDVCPPPHLHDTPNLGNSLYALFFPEGDPDPGACGHGQLVKGFGGFFDIEVGDTPVDVAGKMVGAVLASQALQELEVTATWHRTDPIRQAARARRAGPAGGLIEPAGGATPDPEVVVVVTGTGSTKIDVTLTGAAGIALGGVETSLPVPLLAPEPHPALALATVLVAVAAIRRARRPRRALSPELRSAAAARRAEDDAGERCLR